MKNILEVKAMLEHKKGMLRKQQAVDHFGNIKMLECQIDAFEWVLDIK